MKNGELTLIVGTWDEGRTVLAGLLAGLDYDASCTGTLIVDPFEQGYRCNLIHIKEALEANKVVIVTAESAKDFPLPVNTVVTLQKGWRE